MTKIKSSILFLALISLLSACSDPAKSETPGEKSSRAEIEKTLRAYHEAVNQYGLKAEFQFLDSSDHFFWIPPGFNSAINFDSVRKILTKTDESISKVNLQWKELNIHEANSEWATYEGIVEGTIVDTSGKSTKIQQLESGTMVHRKDGWKLLSGQSRTIELDSVVNYEKLLPVNVVTIVVSKEGHVVILTLSGQKLAIAGKNFIDRELQRVMQSSFEKKVKILAAPTAPYEIVFDCLTIVQSHNWIPLIALMD